MTRRSRIQINYDAIRHNYQIIKAKAPNSKIMAILKANAYGHGALEVAHALPEADAFGVAVIGEAKPLREQGIQAPIVLLEGFLNQEELIALNQMKCDTVVHHVMQVQLLEHTALPLPQRLWLKIDTGMHRLGIPLQHVDEVLNRLVALVNVKEIILMSHFANADDIDNPYTQNQIEALLPFIKRSGYAVSLANSAGIFSWPRAHYDWVRPGIALYGASPYPDQPASHLGLKAAMTLESPIIATHSLKKGDAIGYGSRWQCPEDMTVGVIAIGYGDGYPRHAEDGTPVYINGTTVPMVGRVSMDMITVDLRRCPTANIGDVAVLWGEALSVDLVAQHSQTIGYELLCNVNNR